MCQTILRLLTFPLLILSSLAIRAGDSWPQFGGPNQDFSAPDADPPVTWSDTENVAWQAPVPGAGWSSPVVADGKVWVTTGTNEGRSLRALSFDLATGKALQDVELLSLEQPEPIHKENSPATPTPVLDGGRLYAAFGNSGHACLDTRTGAVLWRNTDLRLNHKEGPAASPLVWRDLYIVTCDGTDVQYIAALNRDTGALVWRQPRSLDLEPTAWDRRKAFSTPVPATIGERVCLLNLGSQRLYCTEAATGRELWFIDHPGFNCPSLVRIDGDVAYVATSFMQPELLAVRLDPAAAGNVTATHILWRQTGDVPRLSSLLLINSRLFTISDQGIASWVDTTTGEQIWRDKLAGRSLASPLYAVGRIYLFDDQGQALVLDAADEPAILGRNRIASGCRATPAIVGNALIVRSRTHLICLETPPR